MTDIKTVLCLVEYDEYSPTSLVWKVNAGCRAKQGMPAGSLGGRGYYQVLHGRKNYPNHRLIWEMHNGEIPYGALIDHVNRVKTDNRIENLRLSSKAQNGQNQGKQRTNTTGIKGLTRHKSGRVWVGQIRCNGIRHSFSSKDKEKVEAWLIETRTYLHLEFANHG